MAGLAHDVLYSSGVIGQAAERNESPWILILRHNDLGGNFTQIDNFYPLCELACLESGILDVENATKTERLLRLLNQLIPHLLVVLACRQGHRLFQSGVVLLSLYTSPLD